MRYCMIGRLSIFKKKNKFPKEIYFFPVYLKIKPFYFVKGFDF